MNAITILDVIALAVFAGLWRLTHTRERSGGGAGYAIDPVCGMQVETTTAPARVVHDGAAVHFCSDRCGLRFETDLQRSSTATVGAAARMGT